MTEVSGTLPPTTELPTAKDYELAVLVQDACNLSGVVRSLAEVLGRIWNESRALGQGTNHTNRHPICRLYAEKIAQLSGAGMTTDGESYLEAYRTCEERAKRLMAPKDART